MHAALFVPPPAAVAFSLTYVTAAQDLTNTTAYTFAAVSLGAIVGKLDARYAIITVGSPAGSSQTVSSVTVGGVSAILVKNFGSAVTAAAEIWICDTTGLGLTASIVVTWSAATTGCGIGVYRMVNPSSSTASATDTTAHTLGVSTLTLTIAAGGKAVGVVQSLDTVLATYTWTGTDTPTKNYEAETDAGDGQSGGISTTDGVAQTFIITSSRAAPTDQHATGAAWI